MAGEAWAALFAADFAVSRGWRSIVLAGDNMQIVNAVRDREASSLVDFGIYLEDLLLFLFLFLVFLFPL